MSKQTKKKDIVEWPTVPLPPWTRCRTKRAAFHAGWNAHIESEVNKETKVSIDERERELSVQALRDICQAGSTVIESMAKALLSVNKNL